MMNVLSGTVICAATLGAVMLPFFSSEERDVEEMIADVDNDLLYRVALAIEDEESLWSAVRGYRGIPHLVRQGRLLFGIIVEANKIAPVEGFARAQELRAQITPVWRPVINCVLCRANVKSLVMAVLELAKYYDNALNVIDPLTGYEVS